MWPLDDITVYYYGTKIKDAPEDWKFRETVNYISDFYHDSLDGYKPPKTARICITINDELVIEEPKFFGAICTVYTTMDEDKYLQLSKVDQYQYLLDLIHEVVSRTAIQLKWDKSVFQNAYDRVTKSGFHFQKLYEPKQSRDRKNTGQAMIIKTEDRAMVKLKIETPESVKEVKLIDKKNWYWFDSTYKIAKSCKWIDKFRFGYKLKNSDKFAYFSLETGDIETNMSFENETFK